MLMLKRERDFSNRELRHVLLVAQGCIVHGMLYPVVVVDVLTVDAIVDITCRRRSHVADLDVWFNIGHASPFGLCQMRVLIVGEKDKDEVCLNQEANE